MLAVADSIVRSRCRSRRRLARRLIGPCGAVPFGLDLERHIVAHTHGGAWRRYAFGYAERRTFQRAVRGNSDARLRVVRVTRVAAIERGLERHGLRAAAHGEVAGDARRSRSREFDLRRAERHCGMTGCTEPLLAEHCFEEAGRRGVEQER